MNEVFHLDDGNFTSTALVSLFVGSTSDKISIKKKKKSSFVEFQQRLVSFTSLRFYPDVLSPVGASVQLGDAQRRGAGERHRGAGEKQDGKQRTARTQRSPLKDGRDFTVSVFSGLNG